MLFRCAVFCFLVSLFFADGKKSYIFKSGFSWNTELKKCASGGEDSRTNSFDIGDLNRVGLNFSDINALTTVIAFGSFSGWTKASYQELPLLLLHEYEEGSGYKAFVGSWKYEAVCGWGKQRCGTHQTVKITSAGDVQLTNYVTTASWGAVTCAETKAFVKRVEIIN